jgi:hypothetical protein
MPKPEADLADRLCDAVKDLTADRASRNYAMQGMALHEVARHLGITPKQAEQAVALALQRDRIQTDSGVPPHSVSLIWGLGET